MRLTAALVALCVVGAVGAVAFMQRRALGVILDDRAEGNAGSAWVEQVKSAEGLAAWVAAHCSQSSVLVTSEGKPTLELNARTRRPLGTLALLPLLARLGPTEGSRGSVADWEKLLFVPGDQVTHGAALRSLVEDRQGARVDFELLAPAVVEFGDRSAADWLLLHTDHDEVTAAAPGISPFAGAYVLLAAEAARRQFQGEPVAWVMALRALGEVPLRKEVWEATRKLGEDDAFRASARAQLTELNHYLSPRVLHDVIAQLGNAGDASGTLASLRALHTQRTAAHALVLRGFEQPEQHRGAPAGSGTMVSEEPGVVSVAAYSGPTEQLDAVILLDDLPIRVWEAAVAADSPSKLARALTASNTASLRQVMGACAGR